mmetsp:Transcript_32654/g.33998  ORF Transcript_32654/g.33998 Transcript_32654/m.33998 type:complete len:308 (+) Transcript_32654:17-940(+)
MIHLRKRIFNNSSFIATSSFKRFCSTSTSSLPKKYLVFSNYPDYWTKSFLQSKLGSEIGNIDLIREINPSIETILPGSNYSSEITAFSKTNSSDTLQFVVEVSSFKEKELVSALESILNSYKDIKVDICNNLNITNVNLIQPKEYSNLLLVYSRDTDKPVASFEYLKKFVFDNRNTIKTKISEYGNYVYFWFANNKQKTEMINILDNNKEDVNYCSSKINYSKERRGDTQEGLDWNSYDKGDLYAMRDIHNKLAVLNCSKSSNKEEKRRRYLETLERMRNVLKEKDYLPYIKPYTVIGNSGALLYNF